jgi:MFS family permease
VAAAVGVLGWAASVSPWQLMLASVATAFGWATMGAAAVNALVTPWFAKKRPAALASAYNGASVGGIVFSPLLVWLIAVAGLPVAMAVVGVVTIAVVCWLAAHYFAASPAAMGLAVDGGALVDGEPQAKAPDTQVPPLRAGVLWKDRRFLLLALGMSLGLFAQVGLIAHLYSLLVPAMGAQGAGFAAGAATVAAMAGRVIFGWMLNAGGDRARFAAASYGIQIAGIALLLASGGTSVPLLLGGVLLFGLGVGNAISLPPLIAQTRFRSADAARVVPMIVAISQATYAFAPAAFGVVRDLSTAQAPPALFVTAAALKAAAIVCLLAGAPREVSD